MRERAAAALARQGRETLTLLHEHLGKATAPEARRRLQRIVRAVVAAPMRPERLRELRVLALLEQAGTDSAKAELKRLATGHADADLTREATAALKRSQ